MGPNLSWDRDKGRGEEGFHIQCEVGDSDDETDLHKRLSQRRCIVPAEAFYEWVGPKSGRQPLSIQRADGKLLSMAGLFNYWTSKEAGARPIATFTVVTTMPNQWMARIHDRMPVVLKDNQINSWLDPTTSDPRTLTDLLQPPPEDFLQYHPVSKEMSSARIDEPACAEKIDLDCSSLLK